MWLDGVTARTLDSESNDRGSNAREAYQNAFGTAPARTLRGTAHAAARM